MRYTPRRGALFEFFGAPRTGTRSRPPAREPAKSGAAAKRISTSHSSCRQESSRHQSPEVRHGPEAATTSPRQPRKETRAGRPSRISTLAGGAGRNIRKPEEGLPAGHAGPDNAGPDARADAPALFRSRGEEPDNVLPDAPPDPPLDALPDEV